ncbi:MAG: hypothetical protein ABW061_07785 [Polyangiaceae bacterium]
MNAVNESISEQRQRIALAAGAALLVAGLVLVAFVLPAEYAVDPLGIGARFGLTELAVTGKRIAALELAASAARAAPGQAPLLAPQDHEFKQETVTFTLAPGEWLEYKYRLEKGNALLYAWHASAPVNVEFHAEPDGAPRGYAQSYEKRSAQTGASGTLTTPFAGIHGWWWENKTNAPLILTLQSSGFYKLSHEFRAGAPVKNKTF